MRKIRNIQEAKQMIEAGAMFYINHSAGKDSQVMTIELEKLIPAAQRVYVHADLGEVEWAGCKEHIRTTIGEHELHVVKAIFKNGDEKDLISAMVANMNFPSKGQRFCTSDLKRGPIQKFINNHAKAMGYTLIVNCLGLCAEESDEREKGLDKAHFEKTGQALTFLKDEENSRAGRTQYDWLPIFDYTVEEVFATIAEAGQKPHWAYSQGMTRLSCSFCVFASKGDLTTAAKLRKDLYARYVALEKFMGRTIASPKKDRDTSIVATTGVIPDAAQVQSEIEKLQKLRESLIARDLHRKSRKAKEVA